MKFGIIGLGSMGKRRVRDLMALGHEVIGFDIRDDRRQETANRFSANIATNIDELYNQSLDACIISTPPDTHFFYYEKCYAAELPFFSEANIFTPNSAWFQEKQTTTKIKSFPSATWMFHPLFKKLKEEVTRLGYDHINTVNYHYGGYLPAWHPWEPYHEFYAGKKKTNAAREMVPFELQALTWIFGNVKNVTAKKYRTHEWQSDIDDTYYLLLEFETGVRGVLLIEIHQISPFRVLKLSCKQDNFNFNVGGNMIEHYHLPTNSWKKMVPDSVRSLDSFNFEQVYFAEIKAFVDGLLHDNYPKTWEQDRHLSDVLYAAEKSVVEERTIKIKDIVNHYDGISWIGEET